MDTYRLLFLAEVMIWYRVSTLYPSRIASVADSRRQSAGLSQQELARRCSMTRQAMNAVEARHYVPSTLVAMLCGANYLDAGSSS